MRNLSILLFFVVFFASTQAQTSPDSLLKHISFLASDNLKGRFPVSNEAKIAAKYISSNFAHYNLKPLFDNGLQYFNIHYTDTIFKSSLRLNGKNIPNQYFQVFGFSSKGKVNANVVFAGFGIIASNDTLKWDDFENLDIKGKIALIFRGIPYNSHFPDKFFQGKTTDYQKALNARDKGAIAVIFVDEPNKSFPVKRCPNSREIANVEIPAIRVDIEKINTSQDLEQLYALATEKQDFSKVNLKLKASIDIDKSNVTGETQNVVYLLEGKDPILKKQYIVVGAHYDHLGMGGCQSGSRIPDTIAVHNGADDNASGVAGIIELARIFSQQNIGRSIIFVAFSAEERGLIGSKYFVENSPVPRENIVAMVNFDMIGRTEGKLTIMGTGSAVEFDSLLATINYDTTQMSVKNVKPAYAGSDHASFVNVGIPALFFYSSTGVDYHTPFDDVEKLNLSKSAIIVDYAAKFILSLSQYPHKLTFRNVKEEQTDGRRTHIKVKLGITPSFDETIKGLKIDGVSAGSKAEKSGMQKGDIIVEINGQKINNLVEYTARMSTLNPGDKAIFKINRNGTIMEIEVQF